jgi:hypothetical protein
MTTPTEPLTELAESTAQMHEMFLAYQEAGFTENQALYLIGCALKAMLSPPTAGGG